MDLEDLGWLGQRSARGDGGGEEPVALLLHVFYGMIFVRIRGLGRGMRCSATELPQEFGIISKYFKLVGTLENWRQRSLSGL